MSDHVIADASECERNEKLPSNSLLLGGRTCKRGLQGTKRGTETAKGRPFLTIFGATTTGGTVTQAKIESTTVSI